MFKRSSSKILCHWLLFKIPALTSHSQPHFQYQGWHFHVRQAHSELPHNHISQPSSRRFHHHCLLNWPSPWSGATRASAQLPDCCNTLPYGAQSHHDCSSHWFPFLLDQWEAQFNCETLVGSARSFTIELCLPLTANIKDVVPKESLSFTSSPRASADRTSSSFPFQQSFHSGAMFRCSSLQFDLESASYLSSHELLTSILSRGIDLTKLSAKMAKNGLSHFLPRTTAKY